MLMEARNQIRVTRQSIQYALQREMLNKFTFVSNILFMIMNNACFIVQWLILYSLKDDVGGYTFKQVILLWGMASFTYGISRFFFRDSFELSETINSGKLDNYLVQPKNVLIQCITSSVEVSAIGDLIYGIIMLCLFEFSIKNLLLFLLCGVLGAFTIVSIAVIVASLSFWFGRTEVVANTVNGLMINFATYPEGIFKGFIKILFYTILPLGITAYVPIQVISHFEWIHILYLGIGTILFVTAAFLFFYRGLKRYSSSNLMNARI
ncbi:MAG: ABC-2 family transporter protein [Bacilli bacterium]|nr:ABC-2 family transporter protein [Bacilli bacterium]